MSGMAALALVAVLAALSWMSWRDSLDYAEFKLLTASIDRIRFYRRWTLIPLALFGIGAVEAPQLIYAFEAEDAAAVYFQFDVPTDMGSGTCRNALFAVGEKAKPNSDGEVDYFIRPTKDGVCDTLAPTRSR